MERPHLPHPHLPDPQGADAAGQVPEAVRHPPWLLWAAAGLALAMAIVALIGWTIDRGHVFAFDRSIMRAMRHAGDAALPIGPVWLEGLMIDWLEEHTSELPSLMRIQYA